MIEVILKEMPRTTMQWVEEMQVYPKIKRYRDFGEYMDLGRMY